MATRAILFVDGNNWYHGLKDAGVTKQGDLDFSKLSLKLVQHRSWIATRYYIGQVQQRGNTSLYAEQRRFFARLRAQDQKISIHLGRLEPRKKVDRTAKELRTYLANLSVGIDLRVYRDLHAMAQKGRNEIVVEKAVDVMIAVDLVVKAEKDEFDVAYLLSADGDFTPAVEHVRGLGKSVFAVAAGNGAKLAKAVDSFIRIDSQWIDDCLLPSN